MGEGLMSHETYLEMEKACDLEDGLVEDKINLPTKSESLCQFTPQQITDHCEKIDNLCLSAHPDGKLMFESLQIIRQLQEEAKETVLLNPEVAIGIREESTADLNRRINQRAAKAQILQIQEKPSI